METRKRSAVARIILLLVAVALLTVLASLLWRQWTLLTNPQRVVLRVDQVWANAAELNGQIIRVRGKVEALTYKTLQLCCPPTCDCNNSYRNYSLASEGSRLYNQGCSSTDSIELPIECQGNECSLTCSPFDPFQAEALELVGKLQVSYQNGKLCRLFLIEVNLENALQLVSGVWTPISVGAFSLPLGTPSLSPFCKNQPTSNVVTPTPGPGENKP